MNEFHNYLTGLNLSNTTADTYCYLVNQFFRYKDCKESEETEVNYNDILRYIKFLKRNNNNKSINLHLIALRHYFNFKDVSYNPIAIHVKRKPTLISTNTLNEKQLIEIYDSYPSDTYFDIRNKVLLGLFAFQGIRSSEVTAIEVNDINLHDMTLTIKGCLKSNPRTLPLHIKQVVLLTMYISQVRLQLVYDSMETALIVTSKSNNCTRSIIGSLNSKVTKLPYCPNLRLLRTSVIKNWLKLHDLRTVQYYAGHKYISSTERYVSKDLEQLKKSVVKYHPLS